MLRGRKADAPAGTVTSANWAEPRGNIPTNAALNVQALGAHFLAEVVHREPIFTP
jgi:hypothetical protein